MYRGQNKILTSISTNGIILIIPILLWNLIFADRLPKEFLPDIFWDNIPSVIKYGENIFRVLVFTLPLFMNINWSDNIQKTGLVLYAFGITIYFMSWIPLLFSLNLRGACRSSISIKAGSRLTMINFSPLRSVKHR